MQGLVVWMHGAQTSPQSTSHASLIVLTTLDNLTRSLSNLVPSSVGQRGLDPPQCQERGLSSSYVCGEGTWRPPSRNVLSWFLKDKRQEEGILGWGSSRNRARSPACFFWCCWWVGVRWGQEANEAGWTVEETCNCSRIQNLFDPWRIQIIFQVYKTLKGFDPGYNRCQKNRVWSRWVITLWYSVIGS